MKRYGNSSGTSGVESYENGSDFIRVQFHRGPTYTYTYETAGQENVEQMKTLALAGRGLSTFISQHPEVKDGYVKD